MSDSPIFDQLVNEFGSRHKVYGDFIRFDIPDFVWDPDREVVPLDKPSKGVRIGKVHTIAKGFHAELPESAKPDMIEVWKPHPLTNADDPFVRVVKEQAEAVMAKVAEVHPDAVITRVSIRPTNFDDNTMSLVVEGLHPTVKPLSEMDTAQPME